MTATTSEKSEGCWSRYTLTIEPIMASMFFVVTLCGTPLTDLVFKQACRELNMDVETCKNNDSASDEVHRTSSTFTQWRIIIDTLPGCIMSLFTSAWSETNGRKPLLVVSLIGVTLGQASLTYFSTIEEINPYWYLVTTIPSSITGGPIIAILTCFCYIIDVTTPKDRVLRLAIVNEFVGVIAIIANVTTPVLSNMGYLVVFGTNTALLFFCLLYVLFFLPESIEVKQESKTALLKTDHLVDSFHTFFKKRPNHVRGAVFALTAAGVISLLVSSGEQECKYLALIKRFDWTLSDYSNYNAVGLVVIAVGTLSGVYLLTNILGLGDAAATLVIMFTLMLSSILTALSSTPLMFYITSQLRILNGCLGPIVKGYISKLVPPHDVAKVIAFGSSMEAFMPQIGAMLYSNVYNMTVGFYPFAIFFVSFLLQLLVMIWLIIGLVHLHYGQKKSQKKDGIEEEMGNIKGNSITVLKVPQPPENNVDPSNDQIKHGVNSNTVIVFGDEST